MSAPSLHLEGVFIERGPQTYLRDLTVHLPGGQALALVGPAAAGKTLMLKLWAGLIRPSRGAVRWDDTRIDRRSPTELFEIQRRLGMVFQNNALFDDLSVAENVAFPLRRAGWREGEIHARVAELLAVLRLEGAEAKPPDALSGGMKKRVALARAMALKPPVLLCDDPTAGLDPVTTQRIFEQLAALRAEARSTLVVVSHELHALRTLCSHVAFIEEAQLLYFGPFEGPEAAACAPLQRFIEASRPPHLDPTAAHLDASGGDL